MYPSLGKYPYFAYDTETTGLHYPVDKAFAFSIATPDGGKWYYDLRRQPEAYDWINDTLRLLPSHSRIICHNAAFDACMSAAAGIALPLEALDDTVVRACLINEHEASQFPWNRRRKPGSYKLDDLCRKYLKRGKLQIDIGNIADLPYEEAKPYAIEDAVLTLLLWEWQRAEIDKQALNNIADFERATMPRIIRSQMRGIRVDLNYAEQAMEKMTPHIKSLQSTLNKQAGWTFNVNSGPQVIKLFEPVQRNGTWYVGSQRIGSTEKGNPSFGKEYLISLAEVDPRARLIVDIRSALKTRDTFLAKHVLEHAVGGRVFPTINQTAGERGGTRTGRLSYVDPAMQQIPSRDKTTAAIVKPCFLPDEGEVWLDYDLNSFEVRIFAALAGMYNDHLVQVYQENPRLDFHQWVADLTGLVRNAEYGGQPNAKQLNLSMIFSQGAGATAAKMGMPTEDAEFTDEYGDTIRYQRAGSDAYRIIDQYHARVKGVRELADRARAISERRGYIRTKHGRRIRFPRRYKSYKASGLLIQATSADINKENWGLIDDALYNRGRIVLNTHDSYSLSVKPEHLGSVMKDVKGVVEREFLGIPLLLDYNGVGRNWWSALQDEGIDNVITDKSDSGH
jgi:DNA polymerase I-like protein with 3'-5' exonuclease and polymerase domains